MTARKDQGLLGSLRAMLRVVKEFNTQVELEFDMNINLMYCFLTAKTLERFSQIIDQLPIKSRAT